MEEAENVNAVNSKTLESEMNYDGRLESKWAGNVGKLNREHSQMSSDICGSTEMLKDWNTEIQTERETKDIQCV